MTPWKNVVLIPCKDEELTVAGVVKSLRKISPYSKIVVIDNGSNDRTALVAKEAGADVLSCPFPGKGRALRFGLERISADSYTFVDGDGTYDLERLPEMIKAVQEGVSMAVGVRNGVSKKSFPRFHRFGNWLFTKLISLLFAREVKDVLSGFRVMSHDLVNYSPLTVSGFEVEAYYTLETLVRDQSFKEFDVKYGERIAGSMSKLRSFHDGVKILWCIVDLFRVYRPLAFFGIFSIFCFVASLASGARPVMEYLQEGYVYAVPRAVLAAALMNLSCLFTGLGMMFSGQMRFHLRSLEIQRFQEKQRVKNEKPPLSKAS